MRTFCVALAILSCDSDDENEQPDAKIPVVAIADLLVDSNRDGRLTADDDIDEDTWATTQGAVFLANVDDDDGDGDPDSNDETVNGDDDALDLARVQVAAWPDASDDAHATLSLDETALGRARLFATDGTQWTALDLGDKGVVELGADALRQGTTYAIEGVALLDGDSWDGRVALTLDVYERASNGDGDGGESMTTDGVVLRQAPIVIPWNAAPTRTLFVSDVGGSDSQRIQDAVQDGADDVGVESHVINGFKEAYLVDGYMPDQWTQDFFEIGATYLPGEDGLHRMGIGIRLKPPSESGLFVDLGLFGPDFGAAYRFSDDYDAFTDGSSLDYGGNLEVLPPHDGYPVGRLLVGSTASRHIDETYEAFLEAQYAQTPILKANTEWLIVGHTDEVVTFVPDATSTRGWKVVLHAPREAWQMLVDLVEQDAANADLVLFAEQQWVDFTKNTEFDAEIRIGDVLKDPDLAAAQDEAQGHADELRDLLVNEAGLSDEDFVELPALWETFPFAPDGGLRFVAYTPGVVNLLAFQDVVLVPAPFGPVVKGEDLLERAVRDRLEPLGLEVRFVDVWDLYHRLMGEVHCGTNVDRALPDGAAWWEVSR